MIHMGHIQTQVLISAFFCNKRLEHSIECDIHHTHEARQVKIVSDVPNLWQFTSVQAYHFRTANLNIFLNHLEQIF